MSNGDCPVGAANRANIGNLTQEMTDVATRLRVVEIDMAKVRTQIAAWAAGGAFVAGVLVQVTFKLLG